MSSNTFLKLKQFQGDWNYINPELIRSFTSYAEHLTTVTFSDMDYIVFQIPIEKFIKMLEESNYFIKNSPENNNE